VAAKKSGISPAKAVHGIHGTNGDREYFLDILSHPVRHGKAHQATVGFLLPLVDAGFLVVCPDLPGMGLDYPGKSFDDETFSHNVVYTDQLARLCGFSYMNEAVYRLMAINDFILGGTCGSIKKLGVTGFSLGGQCAVCLGACDDRVNSVLEFMGLSTYEKFIKNSPDKINHSTYVYGSGLLENVGDQWVFAAALFPREYKKVICRTDQYVDYDGVKDICELMQALYHADETIFEVADYPHNHYLNADMKKNLVAWFKEM
jgi:dienelactone hydrolase